MQQYAKPCAFTVLACLWCAPAATAIDFTENFDTRPISRDLVLSPPPAGYSFNVEGGQGVVRKQAGTGNGFIVLRTEFAVTGDFSATVRTNPVDLSGIGELGLAAHPQSGAPGFVDVWFHGDSTIVGNIFIGGGGARWVTTSPAVVTFRIRRIGNTLIEEFDGGAGFVVVNSHSHPDLAAPLILELFLGQELGNTSAHTGTFDDLVITADGFTFTPALRLSKTLLSGCRKATGTVRLSAPAPAGGLTVPLHSNSPHAIVPASITFKAGVLTKSFPILTSAVASRVPVTIEASVPGQVLSAALTLKPMAPKAVLLTPNPVVGGAAVSGTVTLECPAGPGDILVALASSKPSVAAPTTPSITVPVGSAMGAFGVTTNPVALVAKASVKATANGVTKSKALVVNPAP